jgi:Zn-dependent protease
VEQLPTGNPAPSPKRRGGIGAVLAAIVAFIVKFKFVLLFFGKFFGISWTFLLSLWLYVLLFGWKLAVVIMLVLLAHELGHYFAFRAYGLPVRLPSFIPLLGAFTAGAAPEDLEHDAYIALAGPLTGLGLAATCYVIGDLNHDRFWYACADLSAFLNLFNMIPVPPFDGGRIVGALWTPLWIAGLAIFVGVALLLHLPLFLLLIVALLGLPAIAAAFRGYHDPRAANMTTASRARVSLWYLATLLGLVFVMAQSHAVAAGAAASHFAW